MRYNWKLVEFLKGKYIASSPQYMPLSDAENLLNVAKSINNEFTYKIMNRAAIEKFKI